MLTAVVISLILVSVTQSSPSSLQLTCMGGGTANKTRSESAYVSNSQGGAAWINGTSSYEAGFDDQVDLIIDGEASRIRLPRKMLPLIRGGEGGWFKLKNMKVGDREISGNAGVNPLNNPKVHIDRLTGSISIAGKAGNYFGRCQKVEPGTRAF